VQPLLCEAGPVSEASLRSLCRRPLSASVHNPRRSVPVTHGESASLDARIVSTSTPVRTTPRVSLSEDLPADERTEVARLKMGMAPLQVASPLGSVVSFIMSTYPMANYYYYLERQVTLYPLSSRNWSSGLSLSYFLLLVQSSLTAPSPGVRRG